MKEIFYCGVVTLARALHDGRMNLEDVKKELESTGPHMFGNGNGPN